MKKHHAFLVGAYCRSRMNVECDKRTLAHGPDFGPRHHRRRQMSLESSRLNVADWSEALRRFVTKGY